MLRERQLLTKWQTESSPMNASLLLKELFSSAILSTARVEMAASLGGPLAIYYMGVAASWGDASAIAYTENHSPLPNHYRTKLKVALGPLDATEKIAFAYDCAVRAQEFWVGEAPTDESVAAAIRWIRDYRSGAKRKKRGHSSFSLTSVCRDA